MTDKILPCPFCGSEPAFIFPPDGYPEILCTNCYQAGTTLADRTEDEVIAVWNTRAYTGYSRDELLAEMRAILDKWAGERTCRVDGSISYDWTGASTTYEHNLTCGHMITTDGPEPPGYCPDCGARVIP